MPAFAQRTRVLWISLLAILSAFAVEMTIGFATGSLALLADGAHALLDAAVTAILLLAARMALKPADADHTYGHGKIESLGALLGGIAMLGAAAFFVHESLSRVWSPPEALPGLWAITAGAYTICVDIFRIIILRRSISKVGGATLKADLYHALLDLGSTAVAIVGIIAVYYGAIYGDFAAALVLGILLGALSLKLVYRSAMELTDVISPDMVSRIRGIVEGTRGVVAAGPVLVRKSGDTVFADVTISLRADASFEKAHEMSSTVEARIRGEIPGSSVTVHFEPTWKRVPRDVRIAEIASSVAGVRDVHNTSSYRSDGRLYVSLHVMVDRQADLRRAHDISEKTEAQIRAALPEIEHVTVHLEPYARVPPTLGAADDAEDAIRKTLLAHTEIRSINRIVTLRVKDISKIDIDCAFDADLSIERVHDITSELELEIRASFPDAIITIHPEPA